MAYAAVGSEQEVQVDLGEQGSGFAFNRQNPRLRLRSRKFAVKTAVSDEAGAVFYTKESQTAWFGLELLTVLTAVWSNHCKP